MLLRFLLIFLQKNFLPKAALREVTKVQMRVFPIDLDFLMHVNNGMYFSFMDFGRIDMIFRNGTFDVCQKNGWYGVVAGEMIKFRRSLKLWDKFTIETRVRGYDEKYFFIEQRFILKGELMSTGMVKIRFLKKKGGSVHPTEITSLLKDLPANEIDKLGDEWFAFEKKYLG